MASLILEQTALVVEQSADRFKIAATLAAAESAFAARESGLLIGHCKSLVESISKTILDEKGIAYAPDSGIGWLAKKAVKTLGVASGVEKEAKAREAFLKFISLLANQFEIAAQALGELRNDFCPLSHGRSANHVPLDMAHATFVGRQADALITFLYDLYISHHVFIEKEDGFGDNSEFNDYLNDQFQSTVIYEDEYLPAEILFAVNPDKYKTALGEWKEGSAEGDPADAE